MCGICGLVYRDPRRQPPVEVLTRMAGTLRHRGPDDEGVYAHGGVGLAHRRLSILDLSSAGHQPMANEDGSVWIIFNGEIYNFADLRRQLEPRHSFRSHTDTEVLVHLYEECGWRMVDMLDGMFAFAIFDLSRQQVLLARDPFGIKPLFYSFNDSRFVFGSEIKPLLASGEVSRAIDPAALNDYFDFLWIPAPRSIYADVRKVLPAHVMTLDLQAWELQSRCYWDVKYDPRLGRSLDDWASEVDHELERSVTAQMVADVPIGSFLSGGIDSSLVARAAAMTSDRQLRTFTIDFRDQRFSERKFAAEVAAKINSDAAFRCVRPGEVSQVPKLVEYFDEPFADSSMLPTFAVSRITREHTTVALSGDGGDELFAGYTHHRLAHQISKLDLLPDWFNALAFQWTTFLFPSTVRVHQWGRRLAFPYELRRLTGARLPGRSHRHDILSADYRETRESRFWHIHEWLPKLHGLPPVTQVQLYDLAFYLPNDMLVKVDRASMAHSLEVRVPFLSRRLAELAFRIPEEVRFQSGQDKRVLRRLMRRHFGEDLAHREKMGFGIPLHAWMQTAARERREELLSAPVMKSGLLDTTGVRQLLVDVAGDYSAWRVDRSEELFALLVFNAWWERYCN